MKAKKVLIVDDNSLNRKVFEHIIGQIYEFGTASDGREALEKIKTGEFDLILMDIQMPVLDGINTLNVIKNEKIEGIKTSLGIEIKAKTVVLTNGTFLNGLMTTMGTMPVMRY